MSDLGHINTDNIVCPWCDRVHSVIDGQPRGTVRCMACRRQFAWTRKIIYSTEMIAEFPPLARMAAVAEREAERVAAAEEARRREATPKRAQGRSVE